jgi:hypothetical protein
MCRLHHAHLDCSASLWIHFDHQSNKRAYYLIYAYIRGDVELLIHELYKRLGTTNDRFVDVSVITTVMYHRAVVLSGTRMLTLLFLFCLHCTHIFIRPEWKWTAFDTSGKKIFSIDNVVYDETAFVFTNGLWTWPGDCWRIGNAYRTIVD